MPVPNVMADLATLANSNSPAGSEVIGNSLDDYLRAIQAIVRSTNAVSASTISAASTTNLASASGEHVFVTGSATINSFGTGFVGCRREVLFLGASTIVNSSVVVLPNAANISANPGDVHTYRCTDVGVWRLVACSTPSVDSLTGFASALSNKLNNSGNNTYSGTLTIAQNNVLGGSSGNESTVETLFGNNGSGSNSEELRYSLYRRVNGSGYESTAIRAKRYVNGFSQAYHDFHSGQPVDGSRSHTWGYAASDLMWLDSSGNLTVSQNINSNSDERLKQNWQPMPEDFVHRLAKVKAGVYERKDTGLWQAGVSAQAMESLLPHTVITDPVSGYKSVAYGHAALVSCVALARKNEALEARILALEAKLGVG